MTCEVETTMDSAGMFLPLQELARRTVGIFSYPNGTTSEQIEDHAQDWASHFGHIMQISVKWGADGKPYAIINFDGPEAARAAVGIGAVEPPEIDGWYLNVRPWRVPGQGESSASWMLWAESNGQLKNLRPKKALV